MYGTVGETGVVEASTDGDGTLSYTIDDTSIAEIDETTGALTFKAAGSATVTITASETETYALATKQVSVTVSEPEPTTYNVTVDYNWRLGRATADPTSGETGTEVKLTAEPLDGYQFKEWVVRSGDVTIENDAFEIGDADVEIEAVFEEIPSTMITITFDGNADIVEGEMDPVETDKGKAIELPACGFTRDGYDFVEWNTEADGSGTTVKDQAKVTFRADTTLYAQWTEAVPTTVTLTFDKNASDAKGTMRSLTLDAGESVTLPDCAFTRDGYYFSGWNTKADGSGSSFKDGAKVKVKANVTLYAQWEEGSEPTTTVTVTFDKNASDAKGTMAPFTAEKGESVNLPACAFTRDGYHFSSWNTAADGSGISISGQKSVKVNKDVTLYAQWKAGTETSATVEFDKNASDAKGTMTPLTAEKGESVTLPTCSFTRAGYYFAGWNTKADGSGTALRDGAKVKINNDATLYAQWSKGSAPATTVTITFDGNADDAEGTMDPMQVEKGESVTLPANAFTRDGYFFAGWNTKPDGSGTSLRDSAKVKASSDVTLYAQWSDQGEVQTPNPGVTTSVGGQYAARNTDIGFTVTQEVPSDATRVEIWVDLESVMQFTTAADQVGVSVDDNAIGAAQVSIDGQRMTVLIDDSSVVASLRGKKVKVVFNAKVLDDANLDSYKSGNVAAVPYYVQTRFDGAKSRQTARMKGTIRVSLGSTNSSSSSRTTTTPTRSTTASTSSKKSSSLANTADATSVASVVAMATSGAALALAGFRRRRK